MSTNRPPPRCHGLLIDTRPNVAVKREAVQLKKTRETTLIVDGGFARGNCCLRLRSKVEKLQYTVRGMNKLNKSEVVMDIFIDNRLDSYAQFFDHKEAQKFGSLTDGTKLDEAAGILCATWKAASNTMRLPWLAAESAAGIGLGAALDTSSKQAFLEHLPGTLRKKIQIPPDVNLALEIEIRQIIKAYQEAEKLTKKTYNSRLIWNSLIELRKKDGTQVAEFPMAIWGSQQIGFGATYHAYENFIRTVVAKLLNKPDYRIKYDGKIQRDITTNLGQNITDQCIDDPKIKLAKEIRNSLAHQGGYVDVDPATPDDYHGFLVIKNIVQIDAEDNRHLFSLLQNRAYIFAEAALQKL